MILRSRANRLSNRPTIEVRGTASNKLNDPIASLDDRTLDAVKRWDVRDRA